MPNQPANDPIIDDARPAAQAAFEASLAVAMLASLDAGALGKTACGDYADWLIRELFARFSELGVRRVA